MLRKQILLLGKQKMFLPGVKKINFLLPGLKFCVRNMFPSLATPENITRNIVSATMFPSLARPLNSLITRRTHANHELTVLQHNGDPRKNA